MNGAGARLKGAWAVVPFAPDYEVSDDGRVRRLTAARTRKAGHELKLSPTGAKGYVRAKLVLPDGRKKSYPVHRLMAYCFYGKPPYGHVARHLDDVRDHNVLDNIAWGTVKENSQDWLRNSGPKHGAANHNAKLTDEQVREIKTVATGKWGEKSRLARQYGVGFTAINDILTGKKWAHV